MGSGCGYLIAEKSFVCHTTPHFDSTLREVSYSVHNYHTRCGNKSKYLFYKTACRTSVRHNVFINRCA